MITIELVTLFVLGALFTVCAWLDKRARRKKREFKLRGYGVRKDGTLGPYGPDDTEPRDEQWVRDLNRNIFSDPK